ncbi:DUF6124 family protein [Pseudomonas sp. 18175]|uniref:DUF6124 family protein n=1 Tax=Pseudomonas sp. 18175 TaxID=3390056 RepID=UPI003D1D25C4
MRITGTIEEISDKVLRWPLGKPLSSLRTPLQTQWAGASAEALMSDFAFELDGVKREGALGVAQLIGLAKLLADRVLEDSEHLTA